MNAIKSKERKSIDIAIAAVAVAMAIYHLLSTQYAVFGDKQHVNVHLGFALLVIFLVAFKNSGKIGKPLFLALIALTVVSVGYVHIFTTALQFRAGHNTSLDLVVGTVLVLLVLIATWRSFGSILIIVAGVSIAYMFLGQYLPGFFHGMYLEPELIIANLSIAFLGIYEMLSFSADYVFLFILMGSILMVTGATGFFVQLGRLIGRRLKAGPAIAAVVTSALFGTITGSIGANIATVGSFTIPLMKRAGYKPEQAGAIEAAASSGGQIMPPVMGVAAFAMTQITGIPYIRICAAAVIPALLYFFVVGLYAQFRGGQLTLTRQVEPVEFREMLFRAPLFFIPLGLIVYFLIQGHSLQYSAFWGVVSAIILGLIRKKTRPSLSRWIEASIDGATSGAQIAVAIAAVGTVVRALIVTGMGVRLPGIVEAWSGGNLTMALIVVAIISIILGMGIATLPVYLLVALVAAPVLLRMGLGVLQAHFFVFLFACFSAVTPPVAPGAIVASKMAGSKYLPTAMEAVKSSAAGFLLPFLIVWAPVLMLEPEATALVAITKLIASAVLLIALQAALVGYYIKALGFWERALLGICVAAIIGYFLTQITMFLIVGLAIFVLLTVEQLVNRTRLPKLA